MKILVFMFIGLLSNGVLLTGQDEIVGNWLAKDLDNSTIRIYKKNAALSGEIMSCDLKEYEGTIVLIDMKYNTSKKTWTGEIYSPRREMTIDGTLSLEPNGELKVVGRKFYMSKTFYWERE